MAVKLVIACGGTGGHFYPTLSVARQFCDYFADKGGGEAVFLVSGKHAEDQKRIIESNGFSARVIETVRFPASKLGLPLFALKFLCCWWQAGRVLRELDCDVMLSMGSFAAAPPSVAWPYKRKPMILHEGNTIMGKANRWIVKHARAVALALPLTNKAQLKGRPAVLTGMPLRQAILDAAKTRLDDAQRNALLSEYGLSQSRKTVLVFGGSQGARAINQMILAASAQLGDLAEKLQFIVLTGTAENDELKQSFAKSGVPAWVCQSEPSIEKCYQLADLIVCRGGASSICELALFGKPMVIIPLPSAADNHQCYNALELANAHAARLFLQRDATADAFVALLNEWQNAPEQWEAMGRNAKTFAHPDATASLTKMLTDAVEKK